MESNTTLKQSGGNKIWYLVVAVALFGIVLLLMFDKEDEAEPVERLEENLAELGSSAVVLESSEYFVI